MSKAVLKIIADSMRSLSLAYGFGTYVDDPIKYPYFVGEYTESEPMTADGMHEGVFLLTGFARGSEPYIDLEDAKERIEGMFHPVSGKIGISDTGSGVAIFYAGSQYIPTGDAELKRIQINLTIKEWKVN